MSPAWLDERDLHILKTHLRRQQRYGSRPLFVFPCGGDEKSHDSRRRFKEYISKSTNQSLRNIFCLTAEDVAKSSKLRHLNLLQQEAMLVDMCDMIMIFAESVGSFCELGAFSVLPHAAAICAVAVDRKYQHDNSYLNEGPVREIAELQYPLNRTFFFDLDSPFADADFTRFVSELRNNVRAGERRARLEGRKAINTDESAILVGALTHELIDLLHLFGPMTEKELINIYCQIKGFDKRRIKVLSLTLAEDMKVDTKRPLVLGDVIEMLVATGMVKRLSREDGRPNVLETTIRLDHFIMFKDEASLDYRNMRAKNLLKRRSREKGANRCVYLAARLS